MISDSYISREAMRAEIMIVVEQIHIVEQTMKKVDIRSIIIGLLLSSVIFLLLGSGTGTYSDLTTNNLKIVNDSGKVVAEIKSNSTGGEFILYESQESIRVYSAAIGDGGVISIANSKGNYVASIGADGNKDGTLTLLDRYGDVGLHWTGKK